MYRLSTKYASDLGEKCGWELPRFFSYVANLPYFKEPGNFQFLARPRYVIEKYSPVIACANKSILIGAWASARKIPFRFVAVGNAKTRPPNHVFIEIYLNGNWMQVDATYQWHALGSDRKFARRILLTRK